MISKYAVSLGKNAAWLTHFLCTKLIWTYEKLAEACKKLSKHSLCPNILYTTIYWIDSIKTVTAFFWVSHDKRHGCFVEFIKSLLKTSRPWCTTWQAGGQKFWISCSNKHVICIWVVGENLSWITNMESHMGLKKFTHTYACMQNRLAHWSLQLEATLSRECIGSVSKTTHFCPPIRPLLV